MPPPRREYVTDGHLGGYRVGGDPAGIYAVLWRWLVHGPEKVGSVLDVGCGDGAALDAFRYFGAHAFGIDGMAVGRADVAVHDFTTGPLPMSLEPDLVWSCEFVEHVEAEFLPNMLPVMCSGRLLAMTHALPGQPGWHHVQCREPRYWIEVVERYGTHMLDASVTAAARDLAARNLHPDNYFAKTGLVFRRVEAMGAAA